MKPIAVLSTLLILLATGCGRYMRPIPPESVSPEAVHGLTVRGSLEGVRLSWSSPSKDQRGKELKELDGYTVERKLITGSADLLKTRSRFEQIGFIEDRSVKELQKQKEELRAQDKPSHRAKVNPDLQKFEYVDSVARAGEQYLYRIVPKSYYGDGAVTMVARVVFRGDSSEVSMLSNLTSDGELSNSVFGSDDD